MQALLLMQLAFMMTNETSRICVTSFVFCKNSLEEEMSYIEMFKKRNQVREAITDLLRKNRYMMVETSYFEPYDEFIKCLGRTPKEKTVKVINNKGSIEILRPDITFNIIKELSDKYEAPIKLYYDSTVFENDANGILEKRQMGAEYLGDMSIDADVEMIKLSLKVLELLDESVMVIGHTKYLDGLLKELFDIDTKKQIKSMIYKKQPQQLQEFLQSVELDSEIKKKIQSLVEVTDFDLSVLTAGYMNADMKMAISEINYIIKHFGESVQYDFSLLSKFEYYDGIIFKGYAKGVNAPIVRGGRYDRLARLFDKAIPAVGFSVEFDELVRSL